MGGNSREGAIREEEREDNPASCIYHLLFQKPVMVRTVNESYWVKMIIKSLLGFHWNVHISEPF